MTKTALMIGATGGIGNAMTQSLLDHDWQVRALHRNPDQARTKFSHLSSVEWVNGDAMNEADVVNAAQGVDIVVHAANPPGYKDWHGLAVPMLENSIVAATSVGARLVFPGNVYNYGPDAWPLVSEASPQSPRTRKGAIRVEMEQMLQQAAEQGARVLVVRAADFFGANAPGSWLQSVIVKPGQKIKAVTYPGRHDVGHAWAYLPDLAETIACLVDRDDELGAFEVFNFGGHYFARGSELADAIKQVASVPDAATKSMPWIALYIAAPFVSLFREILEMRYLWKIDLRLDNSKLVEFLGAEPHTPLDRAPKSTLISLECI